jgi:rsbT co-antagonist protein RsbR
LDGYTEGNKRGLDDILLEIANYLEQEKLTLMDELVKQSVAKLDLHLSDEQLTKHKELLTILLSQVSKSLLRSEIETENMKLEYDIDNYFYKDGTLLKDTVEMLSTFRLCLVKEIQKKNLLENYTNEEVAIFYEKIIFVFDYGIRNTTKNFNMRNQKIVNAKEKEILELSAPIVPIKKGVAVLPLIGYFDETRANYITDEVIRKASTLDIELLVIDFSGILILDTFVARHLFEIRNILKLLGIESIVTGIRPSVALTAVQLGLNITDLHAYSNVQQFLELQEKQNSITSK